MTSQLTASVQNILKVTGIVIAAILGYLGLNLLAALLWGPDEQIYATFTANGLTCIIITTLFLKWRTGPRGTTAFALPFQTPMTPWFTSKAAIWPALLLLVWLVGQATAVWLISLGFGKDFIAYQQVTRSVAPITEELLIRVFVYGWLRRVATPLTSAMISSIIFTVLHGTVIHAAYAFTLGILLAFAYEATRQIWVPVLLHMIFNLLSLLPVGLVAVFSGTPFVIVGNVIVLVALLMLGQKLQPRATATPEAI